MRATHKESRYTEAAARRPRAEYRIGIKDFVADENLDVAEHVRDDEADQDDAGDRHHDLLADHRAPEHHDRIGRPEPTCLSRLSGDSSESMGFSLTCCCTIGTSMTAFVSPASAPKLRTALVRVYRASPGLRRATRPAPRSPSDPGKAPAGRSEFFGLAILTNYNCRCARSPWRFNSAAARRYASPCGTSRKGRRRMCENGACRAPVLRRLATEVLLSLE